MDDEMYIMSEGTPGSKGFSLITDLEIPLDYSINQEEADNQIPILPLRNMVLFPKVIAPIIVGRDSSLKLIRAAERKGLLIGAFCQSSAEVEEPGFEDLCTFGVAARVVRVIDLPDGTTTVLLKGLERAKLKEISKSRPYLQGKIELNPEVPDANDKMEGDVMLGTLRETVARYFMSIDMPQELAFAIRNLNDPELAINYTCTNLNIHRNFKDELLRCPSIENRFLELVKLLNREIHYHELKRSIQNRTREDIDKQQREYFLQQQIKTIQDELGGGQQNLVVKELRKKALEMKWTADAAVHFDDEVQKLERMNPQMSDYSLQLNYLNTLLSLPWRSYTRDNHNLANAEKVLNRDHYGLEKVKERILEQLAVLKLKNDMKSPILCLYGPPGVGKTSLGRSIAEALRRHYVRVSLGGVHDEAEIRGHRRTYIGAMPGRIIKGLMRAESANPVFVLDEIDKLGISNNGDPSAALLEVLDPEQNQAFHDNYLDVDFDLSKVMFIATANNLADIPTPLLDRMELIEVSGYVTEEKVEIARRHLIPKEMETNGIGKNKLKISKKAIEQIVENYTRESGVRELEKKLSKVMRKVAVRMARFPEIMYMEVTPDNLTEFLGVKEFSRDKYQGNDYAGVVTGLAWTAVGGEILFVETSLSHGKGGQL
ncbi:MAG: endopeptidase La, partial [Bacteroides sp.]